jgi:hypothetical protein
MLAHEELDTKLVKIDRARRRQSTEEDFSQKSSEKGDRLKKYDILAIQIWHFR